MSQPVGHRRPGSFDKRVRELMANADRMASRPGVELQACPSGRCQHRADMHLKDGTCVDCRVAQSRGPCATPPAAGSP
jgi:hypothetical protein